MIQISTSTEAQNSIAAQGSPQESGIIGNFSGNSPFNWSQKAQKKNKPGIFAKLLEGLTAKAKPAGFNTKGVLEPGNSKISGIFHEKAGKNAIKPSPGKKSPESVFLDKDDTFSSISAFLTQDLYRGEQGQAFQAGSGIFRTARKDFFHTGKNSPGNVTHNEEAVRLLSSGNAEESKGKVQDTASDAHTNRTGKWTSVPAGIPGGEKTKNTEGNGTANVLSFSFREMEAEVLKSQLRSAQLNTDEGENGNSRFSELKGKKGRDRAHIEVRDLRTWNVKNTGNPELSKETAINIPKPVVSEIELPVDLNLSSGKGEAGLAAKDTKDTSGKMSFEDTLARELRGNLSADIVRDATVIVRNGGEGTIRLSLRPASLGDVKIRLEMTENKITGHIIVQSNEALRAFERELPVLEKAFRDSGFSETNLEMSLAQNGGNYGAGEQRQEKDFQALTPVQAASLYEAGTDWGDDASDPVPPVQVLSAGSPVTQAARPQVNLLI